MSCSNGDQTDLSPLRVMILRDNILSFRQMEASKRGETQPILSRPLLETERKKKKERKKKEEKEEKEEKKEKKERKERKKRKK
uniref:Uncharacterized protein n=1 Tax=Solanum tuberosum TaxID=4113 RepID=M1DHX5_SOLTU